MENNPGYKVNRYFLLAIILIFGILLFVSLIQFFTAFLGAIIIYVLSKPAMCYLIKKKGWKKTNAAILLILVSFFIILLPIGLLTTLLYNKISSVVENPQPIVNAFKHFDEVIQKRFHVSLVSDKRLENMQSAVTGILTAALGQGLNMFSTILMMYFFLYFMMQSLNRMEAAVIFYLPFPRAKIEMFGKELVSQTFSNSVGIPLICVIQGFLAYLCYFIAGVPEAGFWAVVTGASSIIPIVGAAAIWLPTSVYLLVTGHNWQCAFVVAYGVLIIGLSDNVVRFLLAKRMADVHPIVTVLGVIMGLKYFGITGLIFGPLLISWFLILLRIYYTEFQQPAVHKRVKARQLMPSYFQPFLGKKQKTGKTKPV
jgi:predicted PurR-regulated permease PerM